MENKKEVSTESMEKVQTKRRDEKSRGPQAVSPRQAGGAGNGEPPQAGRRFDGKTAGALPAERERREDAPDGEGKGTAAKRPWRHTPRAKNKEKEARLKVVHLGGLGEIGKNMMLIQYDESIIVIDGGVMFPEDELLGIDMVIPDYTYLQENAHMLKAFLLTHGHEDHIGAMPYILKDLKAPVYGSRLTLGLLKGKLNEHRVSAELHEVKPRQIVNIGPFSVEFIRLAHSIPDSMGVAVHTPLGTILVISDFKMDMSPIDGELTDFGRISRLGEEGVLLLLADSTNVEKNGFTPSEKTVGETFDKIFLSCKGRIIITSFASNVHRIQQAIWSAGKFGRKVAVVGRGMANVTAIAKELGYLDIPKDILIDVDEVNDLPANKVLILTTGSQGEPLSGLTRMSMGEHKQVHIMPGDLVIISATAIPGNERLVGRTIDNLFRQGAMVIHEKSDGIHVSGHASKEELKVLLNMVRPKFFMPIHGEYRMLIKHGRLAQQLGMSEKDIFVLENGQVLDVTKQRCQVEGTVPSGRILIDGLGVGDVGNTVLKDRRLLSQGGMVIISIVVDKKSGGVLAGPEFFSRGFIFEKENEHIINEVKEKAAAICAQNKNREEKDWHTVRGQLRNIISKTLFDRTGRRPIVLPLLTEV